MQRKSLVRKFPKQQIEIAAEAEAERQRRIAQGQADATLAAYNAEATGQQAVLEAKAEGYAGLVAVPVETPRQQLRS